MVGRSGGQKKRVTTAEMISGPKRTLFMVPSASSLPQFYQLTAHVLRTAAHFLLLSAAGCALSTLHPAHTSTVSKEHQIASLTKGPGVPVMTPLATGLAISNLIKCLGPQDLSEKGQSTAEPGLDPAVQQPAFLIPHACHLRRLAMLDDPLHERNSVTERPESLFQIICVGMEASKAGSVCHGQFAFCRQSCSRCRGTSPCRSIRFFGFVRLM